MGDLAKELSSRLENAAAESKSGFGVVGKSLAVHLLTRRPDQPVESAKFLGRCPLRSCYQSVRYQFHCSSFGVTGSDARTCLIHVRTQDYKIVRSLSYSRMMF